MNGLHRPCLTLALLLATALVALPAAATEDVGEGNNPDAVVPDAGPVPDVEPECETAVDCPVDQADGPAAESACVQGHCLPACTVGDECGPAGLCLAWACAGVGTTCHGEGDCAAGAECVDGVCSVDMGETEPQPGCAEACSTLLGCEDVTAATSAPYPPPETCQQLCAFVFEPPTSGDSIVDSDVEACAAAVAGCDALETACAPLVERLALAPVRVAADDTPVPELTPDTAPDAAPDAGPDVTVDAGGTPDITVDAGTGDVSGGDVSGGDVSGDASVGDTSAGGDASPGGETDDDDGCTGGGTPWSGASWLAGLALAVAWRRREAARPVRGPSVA